MSRVEGRELGPVLPIHLLVRLPLTGQERVFSADYLPLEERRHNRVLSSEAVYLEVAVQTVLRQIHVLQNNLNIKAVSLTLLLPVELTPTVQEGPRIPVTGGRRLEHLS